MKDDQFEKLLESQEKFFRAVNRPESRVIDIIVKIAIGVCTSGIIIISGFLINMNTNMALFAREQVAINENNLEVKNQITQLQQNFDDFSAEPRWTQNKSESMHINPIKKDIESIRGEIRSITEIENKHQKFIQDTNEKLWNIERDIEDLKKRKR